jgi:hypothetical protein
VIDMRRHLGAIVLAAILVLGIVLEFVGSNLVGTVLILGAVWMGIGLARGRSDYWRRPGRLPPDGSRAGIDGANYEDVAGGTDLARRERERY